MSDMEQLIDALRQLASDMTDDINASRRLSGRPDSRQLDRAYFDGCIATDSRRLEEVNAILREYSDAEEE